MPWTVQGKEAGPCLPQALRLAKDRSSRAEGGKQPRSGACVAQAKQSAWHANSYMRELENRASVKGKTAAEERRFRQLEERMKKEEARRKAEVLLPLFPSVAC